MGGEVCDVFFRDILECIKALYGDPELAQYMTFAPERHYTDENMDVRLYHDMHTAKWWWATQVSDQLYSLSSLISRLLLEQCCASRAT